MTILQPGTGGNSCAAALQMVNGQMDKRFGRGCERGEMSGISIPSLINGSKGRPSAMAESHVRWHCGLKASRSRAVVPHA
jgi:hypothetical protein